MADPIFVDGMIVKKNERQPDYVIGKLSLRTAQLIQWMQSHDDGSGWINVELKTSQNGKHYAQLDTWKPQQQQAPQPPPPRIDDDDIPFG